MGLSVKPVEDNVAANEITPELVGGLHWVEADGRRVDDHVAGLGGGTDQSG